MSTRNLWAYFVGLPLGVLILSLAAWLLYWLLGSAVDRAKTTPPAPAPPVEHPSPPPFF